MTTMDQLFDYQFIIPHEITDQRQSSSLCTMCMKKQTEAQSRLCTFEMKMKSRENKQTNNQKEKERETMISLILFFVDTTVPQVKEEKEDIITSDQWTNMVHSERCYAYPKEQKRMARMGRERTLTVIGPMVPVGAAVI